MGGGRGGGGKGRGMGRGSRRVEEGKGIEGTYRSRYILTHCLYQLYLFIIREWTQEAERDTCHHL